MQNKKIILILALAVITLSALAAKPKPLAFDNPGNKRILKNEDGNYFYYRSLPEKSMRLNVAGIDKIELRSFAIESLRKPQVISIIDNKQTKHDLILKSRTNGLYLYESVFIPVPQGTTELYILCYERSIYFRAFYTLPPKPKAKPVNSKKLPNLSIDAHSGILTMSKNGSSSDYYSFTPDQPLRFTLNNGREAVVYVRARLLENTLPLFEVYVNGELNQSFEFSLKRTTSYSVPGIRHLTVGKKITLPANQGKSVIELKAKSDHLFLGRPVLQKVN